MTIQVTKTFTTQTTRMLVGERGQAVTMVATEEDLLFLSSTGRDPCWRPHRWRVLSALGRYLSHG